MGAVAGRGRVSAEGRSGGGRENKRHRDGADEAGRIDRISRQRRRRGEAGIDGRLCRRVRGEQIAREIGRGAIGGKVVLDVAVQSPGGQLHAAKIMVELERRLECRLVVGRLDIGIIVERMVVDVFVERPAEGRQVER